MRLVGCFKITSKSDHIKSRLLTIFNGSLGEKYIYIGQWEENAGSLKPLGTNNLHGVLTGAFFYDGWKTIRSLKINKYV